MRNSCFNRSSKGKSEEDARAHARVHEKCKRNSNLRDIRLRDNVVILRSISSAFTSRATVPLRSAYLGKTVNLREADVARPSEKS